jgi:hypothetical protein
MSYDVCCDVPALALKAGDLIVHYSDRQGAVVARPMDETHFRLLLELASDALALVSDEPEGEAVPALVCIHGGGR